MVRKGEHHSEEAKRKMKGRIPWITGRHHTEKSKKQMSLAHIGQTSWNKGKHLPEEYKQKLILAHTGKHYDRKKHTQLILEQSNNLINQGYRCVIMDHRPIPDIIAIKDGKVFAYEVENGNTHHPRLNKYENIEDYDEICWCVTPDYNYWIYEKNNIKVTIMSGCVKDEQKRNGI